MTEPESHKLGDVLRAAREARGVDLARVERDTKIRVRYLTALEGGNYRELPGPVYTKGFLRNYGSYLGLDTEYLVDLYRLESAAAAVERPSVQPPPRPITGRRSRAFVITPGAVLAALLTIGVGLFIVYLVSEFVTFAGTPDLRVNVPPGDVSGYAGDEYTFVGETEPNARVTAETASRKFETTADADGDFEITVLLRPGANVVTLVANDPLTGRDSDEVSRTILVGDGGSPPPPSPGGLSVTMPEEGATLSGAVAIAGTAPPGSAVSVTVTPTGAAPPSIRVTTLAGQDVPVPTDLPPAPAPLTLTAGDDGAFSGSLALAPAVWQLVVALDPDSGAGEPVERSVTVTAAPGLAATIIVAGSASYLEIDEDQVPLEEVSGRNAPAGSSIEASATSTLRVRVGNAGAVTVVVNGVDLGVMGAPGSVVEWQITRL